MKEYQDFNDLSIYVAERINFQNAIQEEKDYRNSNKNSRNY